MTGDLVRDAMPYVRVVVVEMEKRGWILGIFQRGSWEDVLTDWMCISMNEKREAVDDSNLFGLCNVGNNGTIYKVGKNWAWSRFVGGGAGGELKITVSHPSKGVKSQLDT